MLQSMNALSGLGLTTSGKLSNLFENKDTNRLGINSKQAMGMKRKFTEVETEKTHVLKSKRALQERSTLKSQSNNQRALKLKIMNPAIIRIKQMEKNKMLEIKTGMHPALKLAKDEISKLRINLRKVEEQSMFWRRRTLELQRELRSKKTDATILCEQVASLEKERLDLQKKLTAAEKQSKAITDTMKNLIAANNEMKKTIALLDTELNTMMSYDRDDTKVDTLKSDETKHCIELEKALEDTLADLSDRHSEIEGLKKLLSEVAVERNSLEKEVAKKNIIAQIVDINPNELEDQTLKSKANTLLLAVEKCMFRIALLTQQNEELKKLNGNSTLNCDLNSTMMNLLEDNDKIAALESVCMHRFRTVLKEAAEKLATGETV